MFYCSYCIIYFCCPFFYPSITLTNNLKKSSACIYSICDVDIYTPPCEVVCYRGKINIKEKRGHVIVYEGYACALPILLELIIERVLRKKERERNTMHIYIGSYMIFQPLNTETAMDFI